MNQPIDSLLGCRLAKALHHYTNEMDSPSDPEVILYDLACTKNECFSLAVWRIRLMLNYKLIPYRTTFLEFPDIEPTLKGL